MHCDGKCPVSVIVFKDRLKKREQVVQTGPNLHTGGHRLSSHLGGFDFVASAAGPASQVR